MSGFIVRKNEFWTVIDKLTLFGTIALDTETFGLNTFRDKPFSVIISTHEDTFYFNFLDTPDHLGNKAPDEHTLPIEYFKGFKEILRNSDTTVYMHNAKYDLAMLYVMGIRNVKARVVCTEAAARIVNNRLPSYKLEKLAALIGLAKDDAVDKYIMKHKLYTDIDVGKKKPKRDKHYELVPFDIMSSYGITDGEVTLALGIYIEERIKEMSKEQVAMKLPRLTTVLENEVRLTKTLFRMEAQGVKIDRKYCEEAYNYEKAMYQEAAAKFYAYTDGIELQDAAACYKEAFTKLGLKGGKTKTGRDSYSVDNLPDCELSDIILTYRKHYKRATTYFKNFLDMADDNDIIHCNFRQSGTTTGRLSASSPNLQNVPKRGDDKNKYPVRQAFIPREGTNFFMIDWDQMEYRLLLDISKEQVVIDSILKDGLDVHTATAESMGATRDHAKTLNFMLLYGGGAAKLAAAIKVTVDKAKALKAKYFQTLRRVQKLTKAIQQVAATRGWITNWLGRRILNDENANYRMPNHFIQGGCGDVAKVAMNKIDQYLTKNKCKSKMLLTVHDECIFEIVDGEEAIVEDLKKIMEEAYPAQLLPLTAGIDWSKTDWHNKESYNA